MFWTSGRVPAHRLVARAVASLLCCGATLAAELPAGEILPAGPEPSGAELQAAAQLPTLVLDLEPADRPLRPALRAVSLGSPSFGAPSWDLPPAALRPEAAVRRLPGARFPDRLMARMEREARRYRGESLFDVSGGSLSEDSFSLDLRAREAKRIITRAFDHTFDDQVELLARTGMGLGPVLDRLEDFGSFRGRSRSAGDGSAASTPGRTPRRADAGVGLRVGAHPRVVLRAEALGLKGRIEVPILDEPLRYTIERSFGTRGRAALSGGLDPNGADWAVLSINLSF